MKADPPNDAALRAVLRASRTIAVVGLSPRDGRPSNTVARTMRGVGYRIVPVNPAHRDILGEPSYASLADAAQDHTIDIVNVFRRSAVAGDVVDQAIAIRPRLIWLQRGVEDEAAAGRAAAAGVPIVMDRCLAVEHQRLER